MIKRLKIFTLLLSIALIFSACGVSLQSSGNETTTEVISLTTTETTETISTTEATVTTTTTPPATEKDNSYTLSLESIPEFSGRAYIVLNNNTPTFTSEEITKNCFERYSNLDSLGRCKRAYACLGRETMPKEERGEIGMIKPSGWRTQKYDCVEGKYLYNRCHLIGFQLSGENANDKNLITGTRYLNIEGMLPFENMVADYIKETNNHVMYRVTPIYEKDNLVCKGVQMEGYSVEDNGDGICFNVFCYNAQPSIKIDYATGESFLIAQTTNQNADANEETYVLNTKSKKIHHENCSSVKNMAEKNKKSFTGSLDELFKNGYSECGICF